MKFGPVPVTEATGGILAHSLHLADGRLRKGVVLTPEHLMQLDRAGVEQVTVARLEPGDLHEDAAAECVADALLDGAEGIRLSAPFTGRVNLIAEAPGLVLLDKERITAANAVDPMITVATVPDYHQIAPGGMIATVKIISYAVAQTQVEAVVAQAQGAVRMAMPHRNRASLIVTETRAGPGRKGIEAIETRLVALGGDLKEVRFCGHDEMELAAELRQAQGDLILILTGSATSDIRDTAPAALVRAGGHIQRFGLPVDPGNLLFFGQLGDVPVIGLPGSARSPVLHGADWILARLACGLNVEDAQIAGMGVGGLLKEIPTRPQPRRGRGG